MYKISKLEKRPSPNKGAVEPLIIIQINNNDTERRKTSVEMKV
jgi:hypothetical protein